MSKYFACCFVPGKHGAHHIIKEGAIKPLCGANIKDLKIPPRASDETETLQSVGNCCYICGTCENIILNYLEKKYSGV